MSTLCPLTHRTGIWNQAKNICTLTVCVHVKPGGFLLSPLSFSNSSLFRTGAASSYQNDSLSWKRLYSCHHLDHWGTNCLCICKLHLEELPTFSFGSSRETVTLDQAVRQWCADLRHRFLQICERVWAHSCSSKNFKSYWTTTNYNLRNITRDSRISVSSFIKWFYFPTRESGATEVFK